MPNRLSILLILRLVVAAKPKVFQLYTAKNPLETNRYFELYSIALEKFSVKSFDAQLDSTV